MKGKGAHPPSYGRGHQFFVCFRFMSAASGCYLNFIMVGIYLGKNHFNSKNYVFVVCTPFSY
jgi:hypothetical protein